MCRTVSKKAVIEWSKNNVDRVRLGEEISVAFCTIHLIEMGVRPTDAYARLASVCRPLVSIGGKNEVPLSEKDKKRVNGRNADFYSLSFISVS